jgi:hypothetical protein
LICNFAYWTLMHFSSKKMRSLQSNRAKWNCTESRRDVAPSSPTHAHDAAWHPGPLGVRAPPAARPRPRAPRQHAARAVLKPHPPRVEPARAPRRSRHVVCRWHAVRVLTVAGSPYAPSFASRWASAPPRATRCLQKEPYRGPCVCKPPRRFPRSANATIVAAKPSSPSFPSPSRTDAPSPFSLHHSSFSRRVWS